jgi:hypothetical protein
MLFSVSIFAQNPPRIAVYVAGDVKERKKNALGTRILAALVNSGRYMGIERSEAFLAEVEREHIRQRSGAIDDGQISELGKQFGVRYICVAAITPAFGAFQVSARVIDVETAQVIHIGESNSPLNNMDDFTWVSDEVVHVMFGGEPRPRPAPKRSGISIGAGGFFTSDLGGGIIRDSHTITMPHTAAGAYLFFDATYAKAVIGYSAGSGQWKGMPEPPDVQRATVNIGVYAKYPNFNLGTVRAFPLLGAEYAATVSGKMTRAGGNEEPFDGRDGRRKPSDFNTWRITLGGGADVGLTDNLFLRAEFLYGIRTANTHETSLSNETMLGHGPTVRVGTGFRF